MNRVPWGLLIAFAAVGTAAGPVIAQSGWPARPIRLIVPFTAGSSSDIVARIVAQKLGERLKQQVFVENRAGASGNIGSEAVARAEPDGYTMGLANTSTHAVAVSTRSQKRNHAYRIWLLRLIIDVPIPGVERPRWATRQSGRL